MSNLKISYGPFVDELNTKEKNQLLEIIESYLMDCDYDEEQIENFLKFPMHFISDHCFSVTDKENRNVYVYEVQFPWANSPVGYMELINGEDIN